jgi:hypothetical protein
MSEAQRQLRHAKEQLDLNQPYSPGAFSNPSRGRTDGVSLPSSNVRVSRNAEAPAEIKIIGPEE